MRRADALKSELAEPVAAHWPELLAETGCGQLTAAIVIGRTAGVERFRSAASFAMQSGTAPIGCSSGQRQQHRLSRGGDRPTEPCAAHHRDDSCLSSSPVNALSLGSVALGWFASRLTETRPNRLTKEERNLAMAKDGLTLAALATGIASGVQGGHGRSARARSSGAGGPRLRLVPRPGAPRLRRRGPVRSDAGARDPALRGPHGRLPGRLGTGPLGRSRALLNGRPGLPRTTTQHTLAEPRHEVALALLVRHHHGPHPTLDAVARIGVRHSEFFVSPLCGHRVCR
jgi:hypothetical protein